MSNFHLFWKFSGTRYIFPWRLPSKWNICNCFARVLRHLEVHVYNSTTTSRTSATLGRAEAGTIDSHSYSLSSNYNISMLQRSVAHNCHGSLFTHGNINFTTAKSISLWQNQFHHGRIIFTAGKINFTTAKSFWLIWSRDISSQSAMGVSPTWRSSPWFRDSTCIAQTVEIVCLQQHISAWSMDKVSRNWLMDVWMLSFFSFWNRCADNNNSCKY